MVLPNTPGRHRFATLEDWTFYLRGILPWTSNEAIRNSSHDKATYGWKMMDMHAWCFAGEPATPDTLFLTRAGAPMALRTGEAPCPLQSMVCWRGSPSGPLSMLYPCEAPRSAT